MMLVISSGLRAMNRLNGIADIIPSPKGRGRVANVIFLIDLVAFSKTYVIIK